MPLRRAVKALPAALERSKPSGERQREAIGVFSFLLLTFVNQVDQVMMGCVISQSLLLAARVVLEPNPQFHSRRGPNFFGVPQ